MNHLIKILKGSLVGMGSILPGVSGSMIATILKIYQELITALNDFTKAPIKSILKVWPYIIGVLLGFGLGFVLIKIFLENYPLPITILFIGFILGSIKTIRKEIVLKKLKYHHILVFILSILLMITFLLISGYSKDITNWTYYLVVFLIGSITSIALITPGLSGATLLLAIGYYQILIDLVSDFLNALISFDLSLIATFLPTLLLLVLGVLFGLILMGKIMYKVLINYKNHFYIAVFGIIIVSPFNILFELNENYENVFNVNVLMWIISVVFLLIGIYLARLLNKTKVEELS